MSDHPNRQTQRSRATREAITGAALGVFAMKGYSAASMDDVRLAAGCSKGGLYHHFPGKSALLAAVVDRLGQEGGLAPSEHAQPTTARLLLEIWAEAARHPALKAQLISLYEATEAFGMSDLLATGALVESLTRTVPAFEHGREEEAA